MERMSEATRNELVAAIDLLSEGLMATNARRILEQADQGLLNEADVQQAVSNVHNTIAANAAEE